MTEDSSQTWAGDRLDASSSLKDKFVSKEAFSDSDSHDHGHTSDLTYVKIFVFLVVVTGIEVALSYTELATAPFLILMFAAMAVKFYVVAAHFMHLKIDNPLLKRIFYAGLILAVGVYIAFLSSLEFFA